ncbi:Hypothetical predicted protein, partial [Paramuricea clavata]
MIRQTKYFLATCCLIALGVIIYRFSSLGSNLYMNSKVKIYSFNLGKNAVTIKQDGQVENVEWTKDSAIDDNDNTVKKLPTNKDTTDMIAKPDNNRPHRPHRVATKTPTVYRTTNKITTVKPTTRKATQKPVVTLPPLTKAAATKKVVLLTTLKALIPVVNVKSGDLPLCSHEGENLVGPLRVDQSVPETEANIEDVWDVKGWVEKGGAWRPTKCQAISK